LPQSPVVALNLGNINRLISRLSVYINRAKLFESLRLDQMKIDKGELSLEEAQRLETWCGIKLKQLMTPQGMTNRAPDPLIVELNRFRFKLMEYVNALEDIQSRQFNPERFLNFLQVQPKLSNASHTKNLDKMSIADYLTTNLLPEPLQKRQRV